MKKLNLIFTRDAPVMAVTLFQEGYEQFGLVLGVPFAETVMVFRNGAMEMWRDMEYVNDILPGEVIRLVKERNIDLKKIFDDHVILAGQIREKKLHRSGTLREQIKEVHTIGVRGFLGMLLSLWIPTWAEQDGTLFDQDIVNRASSIRKDDSLFDDCATIYYEILHEIERVNNLECSSLKYLTYDEVIVFLQDAVLPKDILERKNQSLYCIRGELFREDDSIKELNSIGYVFYEEKVMDTSHIAGQSASKGCVRGIVKIIYSRDQMETFQKNQILVAPMTTPWYLPIMKKSLAFVTDEGGVMCHAAVVARELKKPCIIGTKIATKVLKDGDLVEVDAERGVVKIIKRGELKDNDVFLKS